MQALLLPDVHLRPQKLLPAGLEEPTACAVLRKLRMRDLHRHWASVVSTRGHAVVGDL